MGRSKIIKSIIKLYVSFAEVSIINLPSSVDHIHSCRYSQNISSLCTQSSFSSGQKSNLQIPPWIIHAECLTRHFSVGVHTVCSCNEPCLCLWAKPHEALNWRYRSVPFSHRGSCFPLARTQKLCPWRAIDFSRVISVFPHTRRKWNNNRGERENHGVTLRQTFFLKRMKNPKWDPHSVRVWEAFFFFLWYPSACFV